MINKANWIGQDKFLSCKGRDIFPQVDGGRSAIGEVYSPFRAIRGEEGDAPGIHPVLLERGNVGIPIDPEGGLASAVSLPLPCRKILVTRRRAVRNARVAKSGRR